MTKLIIRIGQALYTFLFILFIILIPMNFMLDEVIKFILIILLILMLPYFIITLRWKKYEKYDSSNL